MRSKVFARVSILGASSIFSSVEKDEYLFDT